MTRETWMERHKRRERRFVGIAALVVVLPLILLTIYGLTL